MKKQEYSLTTIAKQMGSGAASSPSRSVSTISRELERNTGGATAIATNNTPLCPNVA